MSLQISDKVKALAAQAQADLAEQFARIDAIAEENTQKVLAAFQKHRVAEAHFAVPPATATTIWAGIPWT